MFSLLLRWVHPVFLVSALSLGILLGCVAVYFAPAVWFVSPIWWILWAVLLVFAWHKPVWWKVGLVLCVGLMMGYGRGASEMATWANAEYFGKKTVLLRGVVSEDPQAKGNGEVRLHLENASIDGRPYGGAYWVSTTDRHAKDAKRSDALTLHGSLSKGFGTYAASMYRAQVKSIEQQVGFDPMLRVRDAFADAVRQIMPDPQAALGIGFLLGQKRALPDEFSVALLAVGLTHVVVASGYNLTILVRMSRKIFNRVSRYMAVLVSGGLVLAFVGITGLSPSMTRAAFVTGLSLGAWYYGRTIHPLVILLLAAGFSVLVSPSYAWGDVGWLLSFTSFAGVMFLAPLLQSYFFGDKPPGTLRQIVGETLSAQILTLPVILVTFGMLSNIALVANVLVLPFVPLAMLLTFVAGVTQMVLPGIAHIVALPAEWLLSYMVWVIDKLAALDWASAEVTMSSWWAVVAYMGIVGAILWLRRATGFRFREVNLVE